MAIDVSSAVSAVFDNVQAVLAVGGALLGVLVVIWAGRQLMRYLGSPEYAAEQAAYRAKVKGQIRRWDEEQQARDAAEAAKSPELRQAEAAASRAKAAADYFWWRG